VAGQISIRDTLTETRVFSKRAVLAVLVVVLATAGLLARYFHLQVVEHEKYRTESDRNRIHARPVPPRRGLIFDRHGVVLADNRRLFARCGFVETAQHAHPGYAQPTFVDMEKRLA
jgi:penicillin-binding protein 2